MRKFESMFPIAGLLVFGLFSTAAGEDFQPLFDGHTLDGWHGDAKVWSVEDGVIIGTTDEKTIKHNTFLSTDRNYKNFVLKLKFKLRNGNSGVQIRSKRLDDFVVHGYQADIADARFMGILYDEGGRGILADVEPDEVGKHVNQDGWNEYVIKADGNRITQKLNGFTTVDYTESSEEAAQEGVISLQLHVGPAMRISSKMA